MKRVSEHLTRNARELRNHATDQERKLWRLLSQYRPRFTRQFPVNPYIIDIAHRKAKLAIELDGSQHVEQGQKDRERTDYLENRGWLVLRFWNSEVNENIDGVAQRILMIAAERLGGRELEAAVPRKRGEKPET